MINTQKEVQIIVDEVIEKLSKKKETIVVIYLIKLSLTTK